MRVDEEFLAILADDVGELLVSCTHFTRMGLKGAIIGVAAELEHTLADACIWSRVQDTAKRSG
jgi:hypothetical protein